jgi:hypothetical protein
MLVKDAKVVARRWVNEEAGHSPGFAGAFYHGSTNWLADDAALPATSDLDIVVVLAGAGPPGKPGKFIYRGVLLDVSHLPADQLGSPELILGHANLAGSFRAAGIIADPSGRLTALQTAVSRDYARRRWVSRRCAHARDKILANLEALDAGEPFHDQVLPWLFATGITTHVLLLAGLKNPTVRRRYLDVRELLAEYGRLDFYTTLLKMLGCDQMSRARAGQHLAALGEAFDAAKGLDKTPFFFASDISDLARPIAIDGSRELIERGDHREAVFWLVVTYSRCQKVFCYSAPTGTRDAFSPGYRRLLGDLGITSFADLQQRGEELRGWLPQVWQEAEAIMAANPGIEDEAAP